MGTLVDSVEYVNLGLFVLVAAVALRQWRAGRGNAGLWAALTFVVLAAVVVAGRLLPDDPDGAAEHAGQRLLVAVLVLFPFLLYRFSATFRPPPRTLERFVGVMTVAILVWTLTLPGFPGDGEPRPLWFVAYLVAFVVHWTVLTLLVAIRLWLAGAGQPSVARRRMRLLTVAAVAITAALVLAAIGPDDDASAASLAVALLATLSALGFLLGLAPPALLRALWRRPEEERLQAAVGGLLAATTEEEVVAEVLPPMAAIVGARSIELYDDRGNLLDAHRRPGDTGEAEPLRVDLPSGHLLVEQTRYAPFFGTEELTLLRTLGSLTGLALDRARLFAHEREAREALERADELKMNFVALAAHELRTPVASIHGLAETLRLRGHELPPERLEAVETALFEESRRIALLVDQLLDLSRLDAHAVEIKPERLALKPRIEEIVRGAAGERAGSVAIDVEPSLEAAVDPHVLERVLANLVANALRYGEPPVTVSAAQQDRHLRLSVEDRGGGVPAEFVPQLFERFARSEGARERAQGSGLGLAIARSYARAHSGDLLYEPATPRGSRFQFVLPVEAG